MNNLQSTKEVIWVENDSTEQEKNCSNNKEQEQGDIINGTKKDSIKNQCNDIGKRQRHREANRKYYFKNKEKILKYQKQYCSSNKRKIQLRSRKYRLKKDYNITEEKFNEMFREQNGSCAICGKSQLELKKILHVDHNHSTGQIRGLLCSDCNRNMGHFENNIFLLDKTKEYLIKYN